MQSIITGTRLAIIGGGRLCRQFLELICNNGFEDLVPPIGGVADINEQAEGLQLARSRGVFTTSDYLTLYYIDGLDVIINFIKDTSMGEVIENSKPPGVRLIDHFEAVLILDLLRIEQERHNSLAELRETNPDPEPVEALFNRYSDRMSRLIRQRYDASKGIRQGLIAGERAMYHIVQGSTIPTFVINADHVISHWNQALERLTGFAAEEMVGTKRHWEPFRDKARPIMADFVLDNTNDEDVWRYYGGKWRKSRLIEGGYEAEEYFPNLGEKGKWIFFTAAPIEAPDGTRIGAIETLWDKTEEKQAEQEREQHNRDLAEKAQELIASERVMYHIVQGSTIPTFVINAGHVITHWNKALERLTGYRAEEMVGSKRQWEPFWESERPSMADLILDQVDNDILQQLYGSKWRPSALIEGACEAEHFFPKLGPEGKWCFFTAAPITAPDGTRIGAIETLWDKTEDKKAEDDRERHNRELSALCSIHTALGSSLNLGVTLKGAVDELIEYLLVDSVCIFLAKSGGGFRLAHAYGNAAGICIQDRLLASEGVVEQVARSGDFFLYEKSALAEHHDLSSLAEQGLKSLAFIPLRGEAGRVFGVIQIGSHLSGHFTDEQKHFLDLIGDRIGAAIESARLHEQYRRSEEKYRSLFDNDPNPIFIIDSRSLKILDLNRRAQECYRYSRQEMLGMPFLEIGDPDDREVAEGLTGLSDNQSVLFARKRHLRKGEQSFFVNVHVCQAHYSARDVLIATTTDITENVEKETQLVQASKMTTLGIMAAGMAHEINQPLNVIQVCADFLQKMVSKGVAISGADITSIADDISANVERAASIIKHMRDFSRMSEGISQRVDINVPLTEVFNVLGHQLKVHEVELTLDLDSDLPEIMAENNRLEQVFINLVNNAVDAMDEKGTQDPPPPPEWKKLLRIRSFADGDQVVVTVADTGTGITQEVIDKIFEPFFTTKEVGKGTGLGVSISYGIVKDYHGTIQIHSRVGEGTTFEIRFPAVA